MKLMKNYLRLFFLSVFFARNQANVCKVNPLKAFSAFYFFHKQEKTVQASSTIILN